MSISLVGGAPAVQFITAKVAGAAVTSGDWVQLSMDETTPDAFTCTLPDLTTVEEFFTVTGVVTGGTPGVSQFGVGTEVAICVEGPAIAKVEGTTDILVNDPLKIASGTAYVVKAAPSVAVGTGAFVNSAVIAAATAQTSAKPSTNPVTGGEGDKLVDDVTALYANIATVRTLVNDLRDKANYNKLVKGIAMEAFATNSTGYKKVWVKGLPV